jgi:hypothetical protein
MTEPDEATMPDRPEKAHGDALEELVAETPGAGSDGAHSAEED